MAVSSEVTFGKPTISPKKYIVKGPSGWPEVYDRTHADNELTAFINPVGVQEFVDLFVAQRELAITDGDRKLVTWHTITGFIARTMGCAPQAVPHIAAVAFWGRVVIAQIAKDKDAN